MKPTPINLLIVDDEAAFSNAVGKSLELRGFTVHCAHDGRTALELARAHPVDIALVDLKMPGLDGYRTLDALKSAHPRMEIVILTGHGAIDSAVACTRSGAYAYLQKPCALEKLMEVLIQAYQKRVADRNQVNAQKLNKILRIAIGDPPQKILEKLADFDRNGQDGD